jgi:hypothetical protein
LYFYPPFHAEKGFLGFTDSPIHRFTDSFLAACDDGALGY